MTVFRVSPASTETERRAFGALSRLSWAITLGLLLIVMVWAWHEGVRFEAVHLSLNMLCVLVFAPVGLIYTYLRFDARIAGLCDAVALMAAFTLIAAVYTYLATIAGAALPLRDADLLRIDTALGFDWRRYLAWVNAHPWIGEGFVWCYGSVLKQVVVLLTCLTMFGQMRRLQTFVLAAQLALLLCGLGPALIPALGAYPYLHIDPALDHPNLVISTVLGATQEIERLRGPAPSIVLDTIAGVVVFPSFHTVLVVLFAWGLWSVPVMRWLALGVNIGMLAATPLCGGHYLADVLAGFVVAAAAISGASMLTKWVSADLTVRPTGGLPLPRAA